MVKCLFCGNGISVGISYKFNGECKYNLIKAELQYDKFTRWFDRGYTL